MHGGALQKPLHSVLPKLSEQHGVDFFTIKHIFQPLLSMLLENNSNNTSCLEQQSVHYYQGHSQDFIIHSMYKSNQCNLFSILFIRLTVNLFHNVKL